MIVAALVGLALLGAALGDGRTTTQDSDTDTETAMELTDVPGPKKPKPPPAPRGYRDLFVSGMTTEKAAKPLCASYARTIRSRDEQAEGRLAASEGADADGYAAADFRREVSWVRSDHLQPFENAIYRTSRARLRKVTGSGLTSGMVDRFTRDALSACKLRSDYARTSTAAARLDTRLATIRSMAANVPWYPRGYTEWVQDDNVAWRWSTGTCDNSYWDCWGMQVISKNGCDSLYVELQIQDSAGNAVGWTNDSASYLAPGQSALLDFTDTTDSGDTANVGEINCY